MIAELRLLNKFRDVNLMQTQKELSVLSLYKKTTIACYANGGCDYAFPRNFFQPGKFLYLHGELGNIGSSLYLNK